jgi:hypothetical protein
MSAPNPRIQDNAPKLSWFGKKGNGTPEATHAARAIESLNDIPDYEDDPQTGFLRTPAGYHGQPDTPPEPPAREIDLLEELAVILRRLTWSQMTEFGNGINADPKNIHEWSSK